MTYYSVLEVTPKNDDWVAEYLTVANRLVAAHGGVYLARTANHEAIEGQPESVGLRIIIQWPSKQAAMSVMQDPDYAVHLNARTLGSISQHVLIEGQDQLSES